MATVAELVARMREAGDFGGRTDAADALGDMGPDAAEAIPDMVAILLPQDDNEDDEDIRGYAAWILSRIGPAAIPALIQLLDEPDEPWVPGPLFADPSAFSAESRKAVEQVKLEVVSFVRRQAAWALGEIGAKAKAALEGLRCMLDDPNPCARRSGAEALQKIEADGKR